jgi:hypothetical protein
LIYSPLTEIQEVHAEKSEYMLLSHHQNEGQNHGIKIGNRYFENTPQRKYFENYSKKSKYDSRGNQEKTEFGLCLIPLVQNLLPSLLLSRNVKIRICNSTMLPVVLYGCETVSDIKGGTWTEGV